MTDEEKLKQLKERKKKAEAAKADTESLKAVKTKGDSLKTETKAEGE